MEECCFDRSLISHQVSLFDLQHKYADVMHVDEVIGHLTGWKCPAAFRCMDRSRCRPGSRAEYDLLKGEGVLKSSTDGILTTYVGRLERPERSPARSRAALTASPPEFTGKLAAAVGEVVQAQANARDRYRQRRRVR